jgi:hypothetical protein
MDLFGQFQRAVCAVGGSFFKDRKEEEQQQQTVSLISRKIGK